MVEKTKLCSFLVLFSLGIAKGKWGSLIAGLMEFKRASRKKRAIVDYLLGLQEFDGRVPGFEHDTHGVEIERDSSGNPIYMTYVLKE